MNNLLIEFYLKSERLDAVALSLFKLSRHEIQVFNEEGSGRFSRLFIGNKKA